MRRMLLSRFTKLIGSWELYLYTCRPPAESQHSRATPRNQQILSRNLVLTFEPAFQSFEDNIAARQIAIIFVAGPAGDPTLQVERQVPIRGDPLTVIFARQMHMGAVGKSTFAGGVPDRLARIKVRIRPNAIARLDVHIKHVPTRLLITVIVQVLHHRAIFGSYD